MKKILYTLLIMVSILCLIGCGKESDATKFKNEYESLNGTKNNSGKDIRTISIDSDNPFIYKTEDDIVNMINNKETFLVYFGFPTCPWCRSMLENLIKSAKDNDLETIYYVNVYDIRDTLDKDGNKTKEGTEGYYKLIELMKDVLSEYKLDNIKVEEKRIYAPNLVAVIKGEVKQLATGISPKQTDAYMELTDEIKKESYDNINNIVSLVQEALTTCDQSC